MKQIKLNRGHKKPHRLKAHPFYGPLCEPSRGFSLVELMIAMVLGLAITGGITALFISNNQSYRTQQAAASAQESGRLAFELLARYIRMAGSTGCPDTGRVVDVIKAGGTGTSWWTGPFNSAVQGYSSSDSLPATTSVTRVSGSDALLIHGADNGGGFSVAGHNPTSATITLNKNPPFKDGQVLVVCDAAQASILQVSNNNTSGNDFKFEHNTGKGTPGNCSKFLGRSDWTCTGSHTENKYSNCQAPLDTAATAPCEYQYGPDATVAAYNSTLYFLGTNTDGVPALYQLVADGATTPVAQEMVDGIKNMTLRYGVDTTGDGQVDAYQAASAVTDWSKVHSVQVNLLACASMQNVSPIKQTITDVFGGTATTSTDNSLCKPFTGTVYIRSQ